MSQTLRIDNFNSINLKEKSSLSAAVASGVTTLPLAFTSDFTAGDLLYIGRIGSESGEVQTISSVTNVNSLVVSSAIGKAHSQFDDVRSLFGDKIRVYRAPNSNGLVPADGDFSLLATAQIDYDQSTTDYTDSTGSSDYWYKFTYYNSVSTSETSLADSLAVRGGGIGNYASVESIRKEAGLINNTFITDADINTKRMAAEAEVNSALSGVYVLPFSSPVNPLIAEVTRKLAAGMVLLADYGISSSGTSKDGNAKLKEARDILARLKTKALVLVDATGVDNTIPGAGGVSGWPNSSTATTDGSSGGGDRLFRISKVF